MTENECGHKKTEHNKLVVELAARAAHEANRAYCLALGDWSQPEWVDAPDWQKDSARNGVKFLRDNPDAGPSASHESWLEEKRRDGWGWGPVKDEKSKQHPCFVPYEKLPPGQKAKDAIFVAVVRGVLSHYEEKA